MEEGTERVALPGRREDDLREGFTERGVRFVERVFLRRVLVVLELMVRPLQFLGQDRFQIVYRNVLLCQNLRPLPLRFAFGGLEVVDALEVEFLEDGVEHLLDMV